MKDLLEQIIEKQHTKANEIFESHMSDIVESKLNEVKKMLAARMDEQITVQDNGMHLTATGEEILPSVYRARRQLAEAKKGSKWEKTKVQPGDSPAEVKRKRERAHPPLPIGKQRAKERAEELRMRRMEKAKAREERKAAEAKKEKIAKKAEQIASSAGMSVKRASEVISGKKTI